MPAIMEALSKEMSGMRREMIDAKDPSVASFGGDADELVEMVDDVVGNAAEECPSFESPDEE